MRIVVHRMMAGNRTCDTRVDDDTQRSFCYGDNSAKVQVFERPWHDSVIFVRNCICNSSESETSALPITYVSTSREVEVHFSAINMTRFDDPDTLNFQATFEFIKPIASKCKESRRKLGSEGIIFLNEGEVSYRRCRHTTFIGGVLHKKFMRVIIFPIILDSFFLPSFSSISARKQCLSLD